jgi:hypothetical protein
MVEKPYLHVALSHIRLHNLCYAYATLLLREEFIQDRLGSSLTTAP